MKLTYRTGHIVRDGDTFTAAPLHGETGQPRWREYFITGITDEGVSCTELVSDLGNPLRTFSGLTQETMGHAEIICCRNEEYKGPLDLARLQLGTVFFEDHYFGRAYLLTHDTELAEISFGVSQPEAHANRISACVNSCIGLDLPADVPPGILAELVALARRAWQTLDEEAETRADADQDYRFPCRPVADRLENLLAKLAPAGSPDTGTPVSPRYYAIVAADRSGPAYGVGGSMEEAYEDADDRGFSRDWAEVTHVEITPMSYAAVKAGNPDAWLAVEPVCDICDKPMGDDNNVDPVSGKGRHMDCVPF